MNRSLETSDIVGRPDSGAADQVSVLLVGQTDSQLQQIVTQLDGRDRLRLVGRIEPGDGWHTRLPDCAADVLLVQQSVLAPGNPFRHGDPADSVFGMLRQRFPALRIVLFGSDMDEVLLRRMLRLGVRGLVDVSDDGGERLAAAIHEVHSGGYWVARKALERLVDSAVEIERIIERGFVEQLAGMQATLTRREAEVLERVLQGLSNKEIAAQMFLSEQGVKMHLGRLFRKFDVSNRAQLILSAFERVCPFNRNMVDYMRQSRERRQVTRH